MVASETTRPVETLLEGGRKRAEAEVLEVEFQVADVEALPFGDGEFDAVVSTFGVMFTPNQEKAAAELVRVCRAGGRVGLANWTPDSFIGALFKTLGRYVPPPPGVQSPALWGTREWLEARFAGTAAALHTLIGRFDTATDGSMRVPGAYTEVVITRA